MPLTDLFSLSQDAVTSRRLTARSAALRSNRSLAPAIDLTTSPPQHSTPPSNCEAPDYAPTREARPGHTLLRRNTPHLTPTPHHTLHPAQRAKRAIVSHPPDHTLLSLTQRASSPARPPSTSPTPPPSATDNAVTFW